MTGGSLNDVLQISKVSEDNVLPQSRKVKQGDGVRGGGGENKCLEEEKRHRHQTCVRALFVTYHHPLICAAPCESVSAGAEHLTVEKFTLSV